MIIDYNQCALAPFYHADRNTNFDFRGEKNARDWCFEYSGESHKTIYCGSGDVFVPWGNKPSPEPMFTKFWESIYRH